jgi:hypothetical protein
MQVAELIVRIVQIYAVIGFAAAVAFLTIGIERIDPVARGAFVFRILLVPGIVLLWPLVLWRWRALLRAGETRPR